MGRRKRVISQLAVDVGGRIAREMSNQNKTVSDLAAMLDRSPQVVRKMLRGESAIDTDKLTLIARWLDVAPAAFLEARAA